MASAETIVRVSHAEAGWLNDLRDRHGLGSVAVVVALIRQRVGRQFEETLGEPLPSKQETGNASK